MKQQWWELHHLLHLSRDKLGLSLSSHGRYTSSIAGLARVAFASRGVFRFAVRLSAHRITSSGVRGANYGAIDLTDTIGTARVPPPTTYPPPAAYTPPPYAPYDNPLAVRRYSASVIDGLAAAYPTASRTSSSICKETCFISALHSHLW